MLRSLVLLTVFFEGQRRQYPASECRLVARERARKEGRAHDHTTDRELLRNCCWYPAAALTIAGLLVRTARNLSAVDMGFKSGHLATVAVMLPTSRYREDTRQRQFERDVIERIQAIPAVTDVSASVEFPAPSGTSFVSTVPSAARARPSGCKRSR